MDLGGAVSIAPARRGDKGLSIDGPTSLQLGVGKFERDAL